MDKFFSDHIRQSQKTKSGDKTQQRDDGVAGDEPPKKKFPKGVVLGKDGKPYVPQPPSVVPSFPLADWAEEAELTFEHF